MQVILNIFLKTKSKHIEDLCIILRNIICKIFDPVVIYKFYGYKLRIPYSHNLPYVIKRFKNYNKPFYTLCKEVYGEYKKTNLLDVGANVGDFLPFLYSVNKSSFSICIEGNPKFVKCLNENIKLFENVQVENCFLSEAETTENINLINHMDGSAHIEKGKSAIKLYSINTLFKKNPLLFENINIYKIDTDGFDNKILLGSSEFLKQVGPIIYFEYDPYYLVKNNSITHEIFEFLLKLDYKYLLFFDNFGNYYNHCVISDREKLQGLLHKVEDKEGLEYYDICIFKETNKIVFDKLKPNY